MSNPYTFQQLRDFLKKDDPTSIELADSLLGAAMICASAIGGPELGSVLLGLLATKNELTKLGSRLFTAIRGKKDSDFLQHQDRLRAAYTLISVTSFFDALDRLLPDQVRSLLKKDDRLAVLQGSGAGSPPNKPIHGAAAGGSPAIPLPHPTQNFDDIQSTLKQFYSHMAKTFVSYLQKLVVWDELEAKQKKNLEEALDKIQDTALSIFRAQYIELATEFPDFGIWANLDEHEHTRSSIAKLSDYVRLHSEVARDASAHIDVGFSRLSELVRHLPALYETERAGEVVDALRRHYESLVTEPIIDDKFESTKEEHQLVFPPVREAYIPQAYKVLRQTAKVRRLESEDTWNVSLQKMTSDLFF